MKMRRRSAKELLASFAHRKDKRRHNLYLSESLINELRALVAPASASEIIEALIEEFVASLKATKR